jgi:hypothetical protein
MTIHATVTGSLVTLDCSGVLAESDLDPLFQAFETARAGGPFVVITDTIQMKSAPREVLSAFSDRLKRMRPLTDVWLGDAVVVNSATVRFILSTLLVVAPMPTEVKAFDHRSDAKRWCTWILRRSGVRVPAELLHSA